MIIFTEGSLHSLKVDGDSVYAKTAKFRPFMRMFAYSYWDNNEEVFTSSVQRHSFRRPVSRFSWRL